VKRLGPNEKRLKRGKREKVTENCIRSGAVSWPLDHNRMVAPPEASSSAISPVDWHSSPGAQFYVGQQLTLSGNPDPEVSLCFARRCR
jgi:hypothetical protein